MPNWPGVVRRWTPGARRAWQPAVARQRVVSQALQAYALMATSAATGAVRDLGQLKRR
jgi:dihydroxy-acid dehydratase